MEKMNMMRRAYLASACSRREKAFLKNPSRENADRLAESAEVKARGWFSQKKDPVPKLLNTAFVLANNKNKTAALKLATTALEAEEGKKDGLWLFELSNIVGLAETARDEKARVFLGRALQILRQKPDLSAGVALELAISRQITLFSGSEDEKKERVSAIIGDLLNRSDLHVPNGAVLDFAKILVKNGFGREAAVLVMQSIFYANQSAYGSSRNSCAWYNYAVHLAAEGAEIAGKHMTEGEWTRLGEMVADISRGREAFEDTRWQIFPFLKTAKEHGQHVMVCKVLDEILSAVHSRDNSSVDQIAAKLKEP